MIIDTLQVIPPIRQQRRHMTELESYHQRAWRLRLNDTPRQGTILHLIVAQNYRLASNETILAVRQHIMQRVSES